jgi:fermentation-respiration switch protein FrsA (DUF1100 family)
MIRLIILFCLWGSLSACSSLLYYPSLGQYYDPAKIRLTYEDVFIPLKNGEKIHAWYFHSQGPSKGSFLFFHGNGENLTSHFIGLHWLPPLGYSYLIFDYPGYNKSDGKPTPQSTVEAGKEALRWFAQNKGQDPLYIYGQSLGGNIAMRVSLEMKDEIPFKAVIVDGSFLSYKQVAKAVLAKNWLTWLLQPFAYIALSDKFAPTKIKELSPVPLLILHGEKDSVVPVSQSKALFAEASEPKQLWLLPEGRHGDSFFTENKIYRQKLLEYLNGL